MLWLRQNRLALITSANLTRGGLFSLADLEALRVEIGERRQLQHQVQKSDSGTRLRHALMQKQEQLESNRSATTFLPSAHVR